MELFERFARCVTITETCWLWDRARTPMHYATMFYQGRAHPAHRVAYELLRGPIPKGLELDHLCRVHACVNPWHLEPVTHRENRFRGRISRLFHRGPYVKPLCPHEMLKSECRLCLRAYNTAYVRAWRANKPAPKR